MYIYIHTFVYTYIYTYVCVCVCVCVCTYTYIHTHTSNIDTFSHISVIYYVPVYKLSIYRTFENSKVLYLLSTVYTGLLYCTTSFIITFLLPRDAARLSPAPKA
jgi:hypothetical protein